MKELLLVATEAEPAAMVVAFLVQGRWRQEMLTTLAMLGLETEVWRQGTDQDHCLRLHLKQCPLGTESQAAPALTVPLYPK